MRSTAVGLAAVLALASACSAGNHTGAPKPRGSSAVVVVTDANDGETLTLSRGQTLKVELSSTYWQFQGSSDPKVLQAEGQPVIAPRSSTPGGGCVPGQGCGTATETFQAVGAGRAEVMASRTTCGEALRCSNGNGHFALHVTVRS